MTFALTEVFGTLQGEGRWAGHRAVFVRFSGCNQWSGQDETRERDAERNGNQCARFCDTDFSPRMRLTTPELVELVANQMNSPDLVVLTGGEPALQVTTELVCELRGATAARVAMETNGTVNVDGLALDWVTVSPKVSADRLKQRTGDELKVVYPAYDPAAYASLAGNFGHCFVQPEATPGSKSAVEIDNMRRAAQWVMENPGWALSVQTHKVVGLQ